MSAPTPVQMLWVGSRLSQLERLSIASFLHHGHGVDLYAYEPIENTPAGTRILDAREILAESEIFRHSGAEGHGSLSTYSNVFRYQLLYQKGGVWCDTDLVCLKPLTAIVQPEYVFASERLPMAEGSQQQNVVITSCFIKAPPRAAVIKACLDEVRSVDLTQVRHGHTGPRLLNRKALEHNLAALVVGPDVFCPAGYWQVGKLLLGPEILPASSAALHFWNEIWRRNFFDKDARYDPLSLYERLKKHYLPQP